MVRLTARSILLVLILLMTVPSVQAAGPREEVNAGRSGPTAPVSWGVLVELWDVLSSAWSDNGCWVDPSGGCSPSQATAGSDNGCLVDPSGGCRH
jgi:hypothetical protein